MIWEDDAFAAVQKVPFFIRKKVCRKVEAFAAEQGCDRVTLADVLALKRKFTARGGMEDQIRGYEISACFEGCPNAAAPAGELISQIQGLMEAADLLSFLKSQVKGDLKFHHEFRVTVSGCPNACSRPQIADIGIMGAALPGITETPCTSCGACVESCPDRAVSITADGPEIDAGACLSCGQCIRACPSGTLEAVQTGYRVFLGGRLGRHPRLGMEVPGILSREEVIDLIRRGLAFYKGHSRGGKRFSHILESPSQLA